MRDPLRLAAERIVDTAGVHGPPLNVKSAGRSPGNAIDGWIEPEGAMPHVLVKLAPGRSEEQKSRLAEEIAKVVMSVLHSGEEAISVAVEEVRPEDWMAVVYEPEIREKWETVYKKPGYGPS